MTPAADSPTHLPELGAAAAAGGAAAVTPAHVSAPHPCLLATQLSQSAVRRPDQPHEQLHEACLCPECHHSRMPCPRRPRACQAAHPLSNAVAAAPCAQPAEGCFGSAAYGCQRLSDPEPSSYTQNITKLHTELYLCGRRKVGRQLPEKLAGWRGHDEPLHGRICSCIYVEGQGAHSSPHQAIGVMQQLDGLCV